MNHSHIKLVASEIAVLWTAYMNDSMSKCVLGFMLQYIEDTEIKKSVKSAYNLSVSHLEKLEAIFLKEEFAKPNGFTQRDVNMSAPCLYSDTFCLTYVNHMAKTGLLAYGGFVSMSVREDIREYFIQGLTETAVLYDKTIHIALSKGIYIKPPYIEVPNETDYIDTKKYFSGVKILNNPRPLNSVEISHLFRNVQTNAIGAKLALSFAQTSPMKEVQHNCLRGKDISDKHIKVFSKVLIDNDITVPGSPDVCISHSTTQTFSDKLIMFHMSLLNSIGMGNYATSAAASQRSDLILSYERLSIEVAQFAKDGAYLMIENNWLEQPPGTKDR
ncbi:DUF3231 family protein [Peribacillus alkalitolerans]|uniref:DUF3231 family protein n=1 Tax=Peribacillus alkalitolerans TaxID=1550385 RepID=UPI0013D5C264|nr:DUF3231 family protein [Peribacillus alkalitolerans]